MSAATVSRTDPAYLDDLSDEQRSAVLEPHPRALVLAGAGSGKTRVLVARMIHLLLTERIPAQRLLAFSFTRKACAEIQLRLTSSLVRLGSQTPPQLAFTFNGFAFGVVRRHYRNLGFPSPPRMLVEDSTLTPLEAFGQFLAGHQSRDPGETPISLFRRMRPGPRELADPTVAGLEEAFSAWKRKRGLLELSDQVPLAVELLEGPAGAAFRRRLEAVLVDEFQDIDPTQQRLFEALLGPSTRFMVFGDDDQAIYRWRGSDPGAIRAYHRRSDVKVHLLTTNYRCQAPILALAADVVAGDSERIDKPARAHRRAGAVPRCLTGRQQPALVVRTILELTARGRRLEDIAVLVRDHCHSHDIQRALTKQGLKVSQDLEGAGVRVLTFHGSKGLEFPVVLLPFLDRGHFPDTRRLARERDALRRRLRESHRAARRCLQIDASLVALDPATTPGQRLPWSTLPWWLLERLKRLLRGGARSLARRRELETERRRTMQRAAWQPTLQMAWKSLDAEHAAALAEERRLCYVAMTRAQDELWLFCERRAHRSEFLCCLPAERIVWVSC